MFVQFELDDKVLVPFWNLFLFAVVIFAFLSYIWERTISMKELMQRTIKMLIILYLWSAFTAFLAFLLSGGVRFLSHLINAYTALPLFILNMLFVILISYLQWKVFSGPLARGALVGGRGEEGELLEELTDKEYDEKVNPFEFQPDPLLSFEELPGFFIKKVKGLLGCMIFDRQEGLVLASSTIPGVNPEKIAAMSAYLIEIELETVKPFLATKNPHVNTFIWLTNRIIVFSAHLEHPIFFLFDSRAPLPYINRVITTLPGIVEEWMRRKAFASLKGA